MCGKWKAPGPRLGIMAEAVSDWPVHLQSRLLNILKATSALDPVLLTVHGYVFIWVTILGMNSGRAGSTEVCSTMSRLSREGLSDIMN